LICKLAAFLRPELPRDGVELAMDLVGVASSIVALGDWLGNLRLEVEIMPCSVPLQSTALFFSDAARKKKRKTRS